MRKVVLLSFMAGTVLPALAAKRVTVEQFEHILTMVHGKPHAKLAEQVSDLELTERLSAAKISRCTADLPGPESRRSLKVGHLDCRAIMQIRQEVLGL